MSAPARPPEGGAPSPGEDVAQRQEGSPSARDRILARLRAGAPASPTPSAAPVNGSGDFGLEHFVTQLKAAHAEVIPVERADWHACLPEICARHGIRTLMLPAAGIALEAWTDGPQLCRFAEPIETHKDALFTAVDAGLTEADCAVAETGTLVLRAGPQQPRTLSLVPPIHLCLIDARRLYPTLPAAMASERWDAAMPSNLIFISGPSKTADIQQTLAYGAHGPKELIVLLLTGKDAQ